MSEDTGLGQLSTIIESVRNELEQVDLSRQVQQKPALLQLTHVEFELNVVVRTDNSKKAGIDIKVLSLGGELAVGREFIHKVKVQYEILAEAKWQETLGGRLSPDYEVHP